jgi:quinol monooxygenase YgiN
MEVFIFARFHARPGNEAAIAEALLEVAAPTREEPGCLSLQDFQSLRDPQLFFVHSRWQDEEAFDNHARLPHTLRFLERVDARRPPLDIVRTKKRLG